MERLIRSLLCLILLFLFVPADGSLWAQGGTAQINGTVSDQSGAVLPGVDVTATQTDTGVARTAVSNEAGIFVLPNLAVGPYRLEASLPGFRKFSQTGIVLQINASIALNPVMEIGDISQTVEVQADAVMVETRNTGIGQVIDNARILELPLLGRQVTDLVVLSGAAVSAGTTTASSRSFPGIPSFSIAGGLSRGTSFTLDGASHNDFRSNLGLPMPFPDALQEFKVETSAVPAQYGFRSGGALNAVTKSGTNQLHGSAFWFVRNEIFNARNFFADKGDGLKRNQYGGTLGGAIKQNKLFFFGGYQGTNENQGSAGTNTSFVPTAAMLLGDFSVYNSAACRTPVNLPSPFVNNVVPVSQLSPAALAVAKRLPAAVDGCGTTIWGVPSKEHDQQFIGKVDYQLSGSNSMFWRYMGLPYYMPSPYNSNPDNILRSGERGADNLFQSGTFGNTMSIGATKVNSFRFGWNRSVIARVAPQYFDVRDIGVKAYEGVGKMIVLQISNAFNIGNRTSAPNKYKETAYQWSDDFGIIHGTHQFNFGGVYMASQTNHNSHGFSMGTWDFNGFATQLPLADFLLGRLNYLEQGAPNWTYGRTKVVALYSQDSWQVEKNLTLSLGLRWEPYIAQRYTRDQFNYFDLEAFKRGEHTTKFLNAPAGIFYPGDAQFPTNGNETMPIPNRWNQWAPRLGLVWDPFSDGKTVIRSAYGIFYETQAAENWIAVGQGPPWAGKAQNFNLSFDDPWANVAGGNPFPFEANSTAPYPEQGVFAVGQLDTKPPNVHQWNFGIQRQITTNLLASASYIGNHGNHVYGAAELNPGIFFPGVSNAAGICTTTFRGQTVSIKTLTPSGAIGPNQTCSPTNNGNLKDRRPTSFLDADGSRRGLRFGTIETWDSRGTRDYHGLLLSLNKRMSGNFSFTANYTWSHCLSYPISNLLQGSAGGGVYSDSDRPELDRGNCGAQDLRHIVNGTLVLRTPTFSQTWAKAAFGDWRVSGIVRASSGGHFQPVVAADRLLNGSNPGTQRADVLKSDFYGDKWCTSDLRASAPTCRWLDSSAFAAPAFGTVGTAGPGILLGPGSWTIDAGLTRTFRITERQQLEFRGEATNLLNHTNFNNPNASVGNANFGRITTAGSPRIMQFALKYGF